jgi:hypothetical protein
MRLGFQQRLGQESAPQCLLCRIAITLRVRFPPLRVAVRTHMIYVSLLSILLL